MRGGARGGKRSAKGARARSVRFCCSRAATATRQHAARAWTASSARLLAQDSSARRLDAARASRHQLVQSAQEQPRLGPGMRQAEALLAARPRTQPRGGVTCAASIACPTLLARSRAGVERHATDVRAGAVFASSPPSLPPAAPARTLTMPPVVQQPGAPQQTLFQKRALACPVPLSLSLSLSKVRVQRDGPVLENVSMQQVYVRHMSHTCALQFTASHQPQ